MTGPELEAIGVCAEMDGSEIEAADMSVCPRFESARCLLCYPDGSNLFAVLRAELDALTAAEVERIDRAGQ